MKVDKDFFSRGFHRRGRCRMLVRTPTEVPGVSGARRIRARSSPARLPEHRLSPASQIFGRSEVSCWRRQLCGAATWTEVQFFMIKTIASRALFGHPWTLLKAGATAVRRVTRKTPAILSKTRRQGNLFLM